MNQGAEERTNKLLSLAPRAKLEGAIMGKLKTIHIPCGEDTLFLL
jgi:hypothetical protein